MICFPNCKINLGLAVLRKRSDGFHDIQTVLYPIALTDMLEIIPAGKEFSFNIYGASIPGNNRDNLCVRAYNLIKKDYGIPPVEMVMYKKIPSGAGLGGGSSDGAFTLVLLNEMFNLDISPEKLLNYAGMLGSDCSFFIINRPVIASGKGGTFVETEHTLTGKHIVVVKPRVHIDTPRAYSLVKPLANRIPLSDIIKTPLNDWKGVLINDFEKVIGGILPEISDIREKLYRHGAVYAAMTGSGSALYGIFDFKPDISGKFEGCFTWQGVM